MDHVAARPKSLPLDEQPTRQPMRPALSGEIARNPSSDQKRVRRANTLRRSACRCSGCGYVGQAASGPQGACCGACGSYRVTAAWQPSPGTIQSKDECPDCGSGDLDWQHTRHGSAFECQDCGRRGTEDELPQGFHHGAKQAAKPYTDPTTGEFVGEHETRDAEGEVHRTTEWFDTEGEARDYQKKGPAKQATVLNTHAWQLNPGDQIKMPNGRTMKVNRTRPHETSANHVYVDTDGGTALVGRTQAFQVVPKNSQQQSLPGYGTPGGNSNALPFDPQAGGSNVSPSTQCPTCGGHGTLNRQGDHYTCSRCGYRESFGGAGGVAFSDAPRQVLSPGQLPRVPRGRTSAFSTINGSTKSAVARRAEALLNSKETQ